MSDITQSTKQLGDALKLVFQILDFSRDLERNKEDGAFRDDGGSIDYVFDASLFEIFVHPHLRRGTVTSLHAGSWAVDAQDRPEWNAYVAQTALATMEYLVDGTLPGQEQGAIYISEWHRWELRWRLTALRDQQIRRLKEARADEVRSRFKNVIDALEAWKLRPDQLKVSVNDRMLIQDFERFKAASAPESEQKSYLTTRLSIAALAADRILEPVEQLRRLVTEPLRTNFKTLHLHLKTPPAEADWPEIQADTRKWYDALAAECGLKGITIVPPTAEGDEAPQRNQHVDESGRHRSVGALRDDARTLALVRWAARRVAAASANRKLIYVTADDVVFDAYRRWYANLNPQRDKEYSEAFILRRLTQYAPSINLIDSGLVRGDAYKDLFKELLRVLETMLLPLNLSRVANPAPETVVTRMRELMALRLTVREPIENDPVYDPLVKLLRRKDPTKFLAELQSLMSSLREFERAALAQCNGLIDRRVKAVEREFLSLGDAKDSYDSSVAFEQYISGIVSQLIESSGNMALPLALEFINAWRPPERGVLSRVPVALRLTLTVGNRKVEIGDLLEQRVAGDSMAPLITDKDRSALFEQPGLVFAIAAAQRVTSGDWSNAQHFAETALVSEEDRLPQAQSLPQDAQSAEILYLNALVRRFRMGEIGAATTPSAARRIERHYMDALRLLNACVDYHSTLADEQPPMRVMRTWSERAALHLFFAGSHCKFVCRGDDDEGERRAVVALDKAEVDLKACLNMVMVITQGDAPIGHEEFMHKIERQFIANIAAAAVLRSFCANARMGSERQLLPSCPDTARRVRLVLDTYRSTAHPAMLADLLGFLVLSEDADAQSELMRLKWPDHRQGNLYLDRLVFEAVKRKFRS